MLEDWAGLESLDLRERFLGECDHRRQGRRQEPGSHAGKRSQPHMMELHSNRIRKARGIVKSGSSDRTETLALTPALSPRRGGSTHNSREFSRPLEWLRLMGTHGGLPTGAWLEP